MNPTFTITQAALASLVDTFWYPNPDGPEPYGPSGPAARTVLNPSRPIWWLFLNPQPLPPEEGPRPNWRSALLARFVIDESVALGRSADMAVSEEHAFKIMSFARNSISEFLDEYCGNVPRPRLPRPWPWPFESELPTKPVDLLIAATQFHKAAEIAPDNLLAGDFVRAAEVLFTTGLKQLAGQADGALRPAGQTAIA